jgi:hypothetical protein
MDHISYVMPHTFVFISVQIYIADGAMEHKPYIVPGEAPESDSEEEVNVSVVSVFRMLIHVSMCLIKGVRRCMFTVTVHYSLF